MSIKAIDKVWCGFPGAGSQLLAMLALADWSGDDGRCFPSVRAIARKMRLSESQARRVMHSLIDNGFIQVIGNEYGGAPGESRKYRIVFSALRGGADATGSVDATGSTNTQNGPHGCADTDSVDATLTVSEPSVNRQHRVRSPKGSRLSPDWVLPDECRQWSMENLKWSSEQCDRVAENFRDYWISNSGAAARKLDWAASWRTWCRREKVGSALGKARTQPPEGFAGTNYGNGGLL